MSATWAGRVVVITGGTAGVGRATARLFANAGARVAVIARGLHRLQSTRKELGGRGMAIQADVADADAVERAAERIERELGPIDVWVNNAMTSMLAEIVEMTPEEYKRVTDVVYHGTVHGTMSALKRMLPRNHGRIVLVGSALAYRGIPLQSAYCGAKHAVRGMFESVRTELLHRKSAVTISTVQLPAINTPQFEWTRSKMPWRAQPVGPVFQPEVAARAIESVARTGRRELQVGISTLAAIVGDKLVPRLADWYSARIAYNAPQDTEPGPLGRPDNLMSPVTADWGAHGRFDRRAHAHSPLTWVSTHRAQMLAAATVFAFAFALASRLSARR